MISRKNARLGGDEGSQGTPGKRQAAGVRKQRPDEEERQRKRIRRIVSRRSKLELRVTPGFQTHEHLVTIAKKLPSDFEPYGDRKRSGGIAEDCSCNCRWFHTLAGTLRKDWGICANPHSPRTGLLTFEHMGCPHYEWDKREDYLNTISGKRALKRIQQAEKEIQAWRDAHRLQPVR